MQNKSSKLTTTTDFSENHEYFEAITTTLKNRLHFRQISDFIGMLDNM